MTHDNDETRPPEEEETPSDVEEGVEAARGGASALQSATQGDAAGALSGATGAAGALGGAIGGEEGQAVQTGAAVAQGAIGAIGAASSGNVAGAVGGLAAGAGAIAGAAGGEAGQAVQTGAQVVGAAAGAIGAASSGDIAGAVGGLAGGAGAIAGAAGGEVGQAVQTGAQVVGAAAGIIGGLSGGGGSSRDPRIVPDDEAQSVLSGAQSALGGSRDTVRFVLEVQGASESWGVNRVSLSEQLNTVPSCFIEARYAGHLEVSELLHSEATLFVERSQRRREFRGIVWHARVDEHAHSDGVVVQLEVMPRAALLGTHVTRKLFQDQTVVEVIEAVYANLLGDLQQTVDTEGLQRSYETREYVVQYDESDLAFISRLCEQEGIFWYFDHERDQPVLMLCDTVSGLAEAHEDGPVDFTEHAGEPPDYETVWDIHHVEEIGATDVSLRGYDWTNPTLSVEASETGRSEAAPAREVYDPRTHAMIYDRYAGEQYGNNTAKVQVKLRAELLDLARQRWSMTTSVVGARPGTLIELRGAPDGDLDQRYLIVAVHASGSATEDVGGRWENTLDVVPASMPYRPPRKTPRPTTNGVTTAIVVGPSGSEIHTDEHGRVRVRFHWDLDHEPGEEQSSCWMRVAHHWAGPGFGTFFLPRVGMEVIVSFLEGDPDRPLVTGCVYHGQNRAGVELDAKKTQSLIRTKSSPNSEGFNEMRFEDEAGNEFIYVHAQKDYNEDVLNNHATHVFNNQTNTVDSNQTETIGVDQTMTVHGERTKTVDKDETNTIHENRTTVVDLDDTESIGKNRALNVAADETITIEGNRNLTVSKLTRQKHVEGRETIVEALDKLTVAENRDVEIVGDHNIKVAGSHIVQQADTETIVLNGHIYISSAAKIDIQAPGCAIKMEAGVIALDAANEITLTSGGATVAIKSDGTIEVVGGTKVAADGGGATLELTANGVKAQGNFVEATADAVMTLTGTMVKIN